MLIKTTNAGLTLSSLYIGYTQTQDSTINALACSGSGDNIVASIGSFLEFYVSNNGNTFSRISPFLANGRVRFSNNGKNCVVMRTSTGELYLSTDYGYTFTNIGTPVGTNLPDFRITDEITPTVYLMYSNTITNTIYIYSYTTLWNTIFSYAPGLAIDYSFLQCSDDGNTVMAVYKENNKLTSIKTIDRFSSYAKYQLASITDVNSIYNFVASNDCSVLYYMFNRYSDAIRKAYIDTTGNMSSVSFLVNTANTRMECSYTGENMATFTILNTPLSTAIYFSLYGTSSYTYTFPSSSNVGEKIITLARNNPLIHYIWTRGIDGVLPATTIRNPLFFAGND